MKKVRRFADGGETEDMVAPGNEEAIKNRLLAGMSEEPDRVFAAPDSFSPPAVKPPIVTMDQVKKAGFSTLREYLNDKQGLKPRGAPAVSSNDRQMRDTSIGLGPTVEKAQALEAQSLEKKRRAAMEKSQALEPVYPEQALMGGAGVGIKSIAKAAQNLANRGGAKEAATRIEPYLAKEAQMALPAPAKQLALPAPARQLGYDKAAGKTASKTAERNARTQGRQDEMSRENLRRYGMTDDTSRDAVNAVRENLGMGRGFKVMKKGGSTQSYASGGKVRSASSRADGCAIRGKTRA